METEYIESYFEETLANDEKASFENRICTDKDFAQDVAFYIGTRKKLRQELLMQKQLEWNEGDGLRKELLASKSIAPIRKLDVRKWISYVAAACLLLFVAFNLFEKNSDKPLQLANNYIEKEFSHVSVQMGGSLKDSMTAGIDAYNSKNYDKALQYFTGLKNAHPENTEAKRLTGIVYLMKTDYDKALQQFDELANIPGLHTNTGLFYKAVTLMERNKGGDVKNAKVLLEQVVKENLAHAEEAKEWLKEM